MDGSKSMAWARDKGNALSAFWRQRIMSVPVARNAVAFAAERWRMIASTAGARPALVVLTLVAAYNALILYKERNELAGIGLLVAGGGIFFLYAICRRASRQKNIRLGWPAAYAIMAIGLVLPLTHIGSPDRIWIVNDRTTLSQKVLLRIPFTQYAGELYRVYIVETACEGTTSDGKKVQARASAPFLLDTSDEYRLVAEYGDTSVLSSNELATTTIKMLLRTQFLEYAQGTTAVQFRTSAYTEVVGLGRQSFSILGLVQGLLAKRLLIQGGPSGAPETRFDRFKVED